MELTPAFYALAVPAVLFAGISKGGFGSGAAFAATPLLAVVLPPELALALMLPLLMVVDLATLRPYWGKWSGRDAVRIILGAVPGVALGAWLLEVAPPDLLRFLIGAVAVVFVAWQMLVRAGRVPTPSTELGPVAGGITGLAAGFTSYISHAGGPPVAVYLLSRGLSKTAYQATTVIVFWAVNLMKVVPYAALGVFTRDSLTAGATLVPVALFGAWLGVRAHRAVPERAYFAITYVLLTVTGTKLIWDSLT